MPQILAKRSTENSKNVLILRIDTGRAGRRTPIVNVDPCFLYGICGPFFEKPARRLKVGRLEALSKFGIGGAH